ncbi:MAG TPA: DUF5916 domain-containing protein [Gemmatimonadales bacterium]|nr:DUF5916 domain-containing protein [Gemmatimonadales bacterium]
MFVIAALAAAVAVAQGPAGGKPRLPPKPASATQAVAIRAAHPPVIDGRDDDDVWRTAQVITDFREWDPVEDTTPRFRTEAKIAYDDRNLYAFVRAFDPHPDSVKRLLARRDVLTPTDHIGLIIDAYHDRRTGYEFWVNPAGVKVDIAVYDDDHEDESWDGIWDVATTVDSLGWTAEFRIPLSQLRYPIEATHVFGFAVTRDIERFKERLAWPVFRRSRPGLSSQLGDLSGVDSISSPRRAELTPYTVTKNISVPNATGFGRDQRLSVGADLKYGVASNLTLNATINPDFGQVEADPSVLNLSTFETFYQEKRPFFVEGAGLFRADLDCNQVNCQGEELFYSRRIGRPPQLDFGASSSAQAATIDAAAKLTGRSAGGLTLGVLDAVTARATDDSGRTIEPTTNYGVLRISQDIDGGKSGLGGMLTTVNRSLDALTEPLLRRSAYVGGVNARHKFWSDNYEVSGWLDLSRIAGTRQAIALAETSSVHYLQRPDANLGFDSTRTSLSGDAEFVRFAKIGGARTSFETSYQRVSPGFEANDLGYLQRADKEDWSTWFGVFWKQPSKWYTSAQWNFNWWQWWNAEGLASERAFNSNAHIQLLNHWWVHGGGTYGQLGATFCDHCARGGPALRQDTYVAPWFGFNGDERKLIVPNVFVNLFRGDAGHSSNVNLQPAVTFQLSSRFQPGVGLNISHSVNDIQWYGNFTDSAAVTHYTFAHLDQKTASIQLRLDYTATPTLTVQFYGEPFVSKGTYSAVRELSATPRASAYDARFAAYGDTAVTNNPGGFNFKEFRSNLVLRWEYRPGSTLYVVWTQGRDAFDPVAGTRSFSGDVNDLFHTHPNNTFLIKASYWLDW